MKQYLIRSLYLLICISVQHVAFAQEQTVSNWQIGFGAGYTNYSGDLSNYRIRGLEDISKLYRFADYNKYYIDKPSLTVLLQKNITPTLGFMIQANSLTFAMSDRYRNKNGSIDTNSLHYSRSLNFRTSLQDAGIAFTFRTNNGKVLPANAFFYPSFFVGAGVSRFKVTGDLYNESNQPYNYRLPGNINDGVFETNLRDQRTETADRYRNVAPYLDLGLGLNFRLSEFIGLSVQSDIKYSASDYLDDVSGKYKTSYATPQEQYAAKPGYNVVNAALQRGDDNGTNDFYINNRVVLSIGLGRGKAKATKAFVAPPVYTLSQPYNLQNRQADSLRKRQVATGDSLAALKKDSLLLLRRSYDSLIRVKDTAVYLNKRITAGPNDSLQQELGAIRSELKEIRLLLKDQQAGPRYRQLQYQADSLKSLQNKISSQRTPAREDNLRLRIYQLQADSIRYEMEKLQTHEYNSPVEYRPAGAQPQAADMRKNGSYLVVQDVMLSDTLEEELPVRKDTVSVAEIRTYNDQIKELKQDKRYKTNPAFRKNVDSLNKRLSVYDQQMKALPRQQAQVQQVRRDTVSNAADQRKIDSLQRRMKELEKKTGMQPITDTSSYKKIREEAAQRAANARAVDSEAVNRNISRLENDLRLRADSVGNLKRQLQLASDSAAFYSRMVPVDSSNRQPVKKKWYKNLFKSKRKMDQAAEQTADQDRFAEQQRQYQQQADRANQSIAELEERNKVLSDQHDELVSTRSKWRQDDVVIQAAPPSPAVIYPAETYQGNNYNNAGRAELQSLRDEIERLRNRVDQVNERGNTYVPVTLPPVEAAVAPVAAVQAPVAMVQDTAAMLQLRNELNMLHSQLDSIKNTKPATVVKETPAPDPKFDVRSFPVTSVYFNSGSAVLTSDQVRKLVPFAQVAAKNTDATVLLKGFTDPTGNPAVNQAIALKRSAYVKELLVKRFSIPESRIAADEPASSSSEKSRKPNPLQRRVDVEFN